MLWDRCEPLVQKKLKAMMISTNNERSPPKIWPPMSYGLNKSNKLSFIGSQFGMAWCNRPTEESDRSSALMKNHTKPRARSIALHHEHL
uniref:Uncharacterized protein n=1 Tax=Arundo donax TaxID=35708 RepID=A0A0A9APX8_ARUDO